MHLARLAAPLLVLGLAVGACTGSGASSTPTAAPASAGPASVAPASVAPASVAPAASAAGADGGDGYTRGSGSGYGSGSGSGAPADAPAVSLAKTGLGNVLVDGNGMTLYLFAPDTATTSACKGACASNWPPLTGGTPKLGAGLDAEDFATISRDDGTKQLTFYGHPLYTFVGDQSAGDTTGQGQGGGKWHAVDSDGKPIK
jgi:predicted lipoprotein with Yx(FWY)xxD motif